MKKQIFIAFVAAMSVISAGCRGGSKQPEGALTHAKELPAISADADSLMAYVKAQVDFGPRVPGSDAHRRCADFIVSRLSAAGASVVVTDTLVTIGSPTPQHVRNIQASIGPDDARRRVLLLAHYDTRPWADNDPDETVHSKPIDGANDGASGVAVILEIARLAKQLPPDLALELLFVDAEDSGTYSEDDTWCVGSQLWASMRRPSDPRIDYGILLDMVGGRDAQFYREYFSEHYAPAVNNRIWRAASLLGHDDRFIDATHGAINDDHVPIIRAGIPCIDIIESNHPLTGSFNPSWHTLADNIHNIDPLTMKIVADVVFKTLQQP